MPSKRKKNEARKAKKRGGGKAKSQSQSACPNFASKQFASGSEGREVYDQ